MIPSIARAATRRAALPAFCSLLFALNATPARAQLVLNEIDYDQPGADTAEFIELKNNGTTVINLDAFEIHLVNGSNGSVYDTIDLPNADLPAGAYFVLCGDAAGVPECDFPAAFTSLQNGAPDAVALVLAGAVVDVVSYEGDVPGFVEGSGAGLEDDAGEPFAGLSRFPDGADTDDNGADLSLRCITPGVANTAATTGCTPPAPALNATKTDVLLEADGDNLADPGEKIRYTIVVENTGSRDALAVRFDDAPDANTSLVTGSVTTTRGSISSGNSPGDTSVGVDLGALAPGATATITFDVALNDPLPPGVAQASNQGVVAAQGVDPVPTDDPATPTPGDPTRTPLDNPATFDLVLNEIDYDQPGADTAEFIELKNTGTASLNLDAFEIQLINGSSGSVYGTIDLPAVNLPAGDYFVVCADAASVPNCDFPAAFSSLQNGAPDAVALVFGAGLVDALSYEGDVPGFVEGSGAGLEDAEGEAELGLSRLPDGEDTDQNNVDFSPRCISPGEANEAASARCGVADLELEKDDGGVTASPGGGLVYTLRYTNLGAETATGVEIAETVPAHTMFDAAASDPGWICTPDGSAGNPCTLALGDLAPGAVGSVTFAVTVDDPLPGGIMEIENEARIAAIAPADPDSSNDRALKRTPLDVVTEVVAAKTDALAQDADGDGSADPGDVIAYTITLTNTGNQTLAAVTFDDTPAANTTLVAGSITTSQGSVTGGQGGTPPVTVDVGDLPAGATATITFAVTMNGSLPPAVAEVANQGTAQAANLAAPASTDDPATPAPGDATTTPVDNPVNLLLNEFVADHAGTDTHEFVEVYGDPGIDFTGLFILEIEGDAGSSLGEIDGVFPVGTTDGNGIWATGFLGNALENGTLTLLLVQHFTGQPGDDLDTDDDGTFDAIPWRRLADAVAVTDGGTGDRTYAADVLAPGLGGNSAKVGGASRLPDGDGAWTRNDPDGAGLPGFAGTPDFGEALNTPGIRNAPVPPPPPAADPVLNEFVFDHAGPDMQEYVELFGEANAIYTRFSILALEGDAREGPGEIDEVFDVGTADAGGFWVTGFFGNRLENGAVTLLLVEDFVGRKDDDLDTNDDGTLDATPWGRLVDAVAATDGNGAGQTYAGTVLMPGFDGIAAEVGGASRVPDGTATWLRNDFDQAGLPGILGSPQDGEALNTPGAPNQAVEPAPILFAHKTARLLLDRDGDGRADSLKLIQYTVTLINAGDAPALGVVYEDAPDVATSLVEGSILTSRGVVITIAPDGRRFRVVVGTIPRGSTVTLEYKVWVHEPLPPGLAEITNQGRLAGLNFAEILTDNPYTPTPGDATVLPLPLSDLRLEKTVDEAAPAAGDLVTFLLTLTNDGPHIASLVEVQTWLPAALLFAEAEASGPEDSYAPTTGRWRMPRLTPGTSATLRLIARVDAAGPVTTTAEVVALAGFDPDAVPNDGKGDDFVQTRINAVGADLALAQTVAFRQAEIGDELRFTLTLRNHGPLDAANVVLTEALPDGLRLAAISLGEAGCASDEGVLTCTLGTLAADDSLVLEVMTEAIAVGVFTNSATTKAETPDPNLPNNTASATVEVTEPAPLLPSVPAPLAPENGAVAASDAPRLAWHAADHATTYHLQVAYDLAFQTLLHDATSWPDTLFVAGPLEAGAVYFWRVRGVGDGGAGGWSDTFRFSTPAAVSVERINGERPTAYRLGASYPNPFNPTARVPFDLPQAGPVTLRVYDLLGREVATLVDATLPAGRYEATWHASTLPTGLYLYRLRASHFTEVRQMMLVK